MSENDDLETGEQNSDARAAVAESEESEEYKLSATAEIDDVGPCKKHVRITIPRVDISHFYDEEVQTLANKAEVPGFRIGHVPTKLIQRRFRQELNDQVKQKLLLQSLEQVAEDHELDPINEPDIDFENLELPEEGDFVYEFEVEVRPDFDLPDYTGLTIERPVREVTEEDVDEYLTRYLDQYSQLVPHDGPAEPGDHLVISARFEHNGEPIHKISEMTVRNLPTLRFYDAELDGFDQLMTAAKIDETREAELTVSPESEAVEMRGEKIQAIFTVLDIKRLRLPEMNKDFLQRIGAESEEELRENIRGMLERQVTYQQRQSTREQVLEKITESADWELPEELVRRQMENALRREILEMQQAGFTRHEIQARENELRQQAISTTRQALKEHFVLDKIATTENIEVQPEDISLEIQMMAMQRGESPRRVRARLVKSGMIENLEAQIRERKAVDFILGKAQFTEVPMERPEDRGVEAVRYSVCGLRPEAESAAETETE